MAERTENDREASKRTPAPAGTPTADREIVQERVFDAPRALVWQAWTDPRHIDQWWGPNGFRNETHAMEFRVGGTWRFRMHGPDGKVWPNWIRYDEIAEPERVVYAHGGEGDEPHFHVTVTFAEEGKRTRVTMRSIFPTPEALAAVMKFGAMEGGRQTLARLAGYLPHLEDGSAARSMVLSRLLDAPAALVFRAWSDPGMIARWWGPKGFTLPTCEVDFRPGGAFRMEMRDPEGKPHPIRGHYREIVANERIVFDTVIAVMDDFEIRTTVTFLEEGDRTLLTVQQVRLVEEDAAKGQTEGWSGTLEKLDAALRPS